MDSTYFATTSWQLADGEDFLGDQYSRAHELQFPGGTVVIGSASPHVVPAPWALPEHVDPEEGFIASLSSCHMLFFLSLAARRRYTVVSYIDQAEGELGKNEDGKMCMTQVTLKPHAEFLGENIPDAEAIEKLHHRAHDLCYIANSVKSEIVIDIQ